MSKITEAFINICNKRKSDTAVIYSRHGELVTKTFDDLFRDVCDAREYMISCGVVIGDRILAFSRSSYSLCVFMLASLTLGASVMYVDIFAKQDKLSRIFSDYRPEFILVSDRTKYLRFFFREIGSIRRVINTDKAKRAGTGDDHHPFDDIPEDTLALLTMTTGSTGKPKIALRTHSDLMSQLELIRCNTNNATNNETVLTTSYIYVFSNILNGFATVLPQLDISARKSTIDRKLAVFAHLPITMIITSPDLCLKADNVFPHLRTLYFGGAILNLNEAERIRKKFPCSENIVIYGSTEFSIICSIKLDEYVRILSQTGNSPLGYPVNGVSIELKDDGEITVAGRALLENYLVSESNTKIKKNDGTLFHRTGDMAFFKNGIYYYLGKSKYYITSDGTKIYCNTIEQRIIRGIPSIPKCAVVGMKNGIYIVVERCSATKAADFEEKILSASGIKDARIIYVKSIPCDVKHHTKINYIKLKKRMERYDGI